MTAALESFSDKLDAWTVLLTELCRKEKRERLVSARRRGLFAERHSSRPQKQRGQNIDDDGRRRKEAHYKKKKENRNSPKGSNARSPTYRLDETFAEVICLPAKVADCIERAILVVCAFLVRLYMTRLRMGKIDLYSRTSKRASF